jgi:hypothetical protein
MQQAGSWSFSLYIQVQAGIAFRDVVSIIPRLTMYAY